MRIVHWTLSNHSGLNRVATMLCAAERAIGLESFVCWTDGGSQEAPPDSFATVPENEALTTDIHVLHSHIPNTAKGKKVFLPHGTPEHCFQLTIEQMKNNYCGGDAIGMTYYWANRADIVVTFWPRHAALIQTIAPKSRIEVIPMGIEKSFWQEGTSQGKYAGEPSFLNAENGHAIKWPLDIFLMWPFIMAEKPDAMLHAFYLPADMHRFWYPLMYLNGTSYKSYSGSMYLLKPSLRNALKSVDYYLSPVRYGDFNTICLEAKATGCKVISYRGNPYADYWITEGDQRVMAEELLAIINGEIEPRQPLEVPDISETAEAMKGIYEQI